VCGLHVLHIDTEFLPEGRESGLNTVRRDDHEGQVASRAKPIANLGVVFGRHGVSGISRQTDACPLASDVVAIYGVDNPSAPGDNRSNLSNESIALAIIRRWAMKELYVSV